MVRGWTRLDRGRQEAACARRRHVSRDGRPQALQEAAAQARDALAPGWPVIVAGRPSSPPGPRAPPRRHPRTRAHRPGRPALRRGLRRLGRRDARQRRRHRDALRARRPRLRRAGGARGLRGASARPRAPPACPAAAHRRGVPDRLDHAGAGGGNPRSRPRGGFVGTVLAGRGVRGPRRRRGAGRVVGHLAPDLHRRGGHPGRVPVRGGTDPGHRGRGRRRSPGHRRPHGRHDACHPALDRGDGRTPPSGHGCRAGSRGADRGSAGSPRRGRLLRARRAPVSAGARHLGARRAGHARRGTPDLRR